MEALFIILNKEDYLEDILKVLVKFNVKGATILDSQGMGSAILSNDIRSIPLFGSLKMLLSDDYHPYNKTIFTVLNKEIVHDVVADIRQVLSEIKGPGVGFMFTVPVSETFTIENKHR